eukprot:TRINITY_DN2172_c0_g2_i1.p1 TRINITY_DN2172_c0_g2~~TRINITY_DN2172_c0_g2_i1.p1  ORF type:complete len:401 (-),score=108.83 TRINITY_DN2172_c0_g2_i1:66-1268(-)
MSLIEANDLIRLVVRAFYDPTSVVVMDYILRENKSMRDDDIARALHLPQKMVRKVLQDLKLGCMVESSTKHMEATGPHQRASAHLFWWIDYKRVIDIVKYKLYILKQRITKQIEKEKEVQMYECPSCNTKFTAYDAASLMGPSGALHCEHCNAELQEVTGADTATINHERQMLMATQFKRIIELLKELEGKPMPSFPKPQLAEKSENGEIRLDSTMKKAVVSTRLASDPNNFEITVDLPGSSKPASLMSGKDSAPSAKEPLPWMNSQTAQTTTSTPTTTIANTTNTSNSTTTSTSQVTPTEIKQEKSEEQTQEDLQAIFYQQYLEELKKQQEHELQKQQEMEKIKPEKIEDEFVHNNIVYVQGEPKNLLDITDADKDNMTPEEYNDYGTKYMEYLSSMHS